MAADIQKLDLVDIELNNGNIHRSWMEHSIGLTDVKANAFGVRVFRNGEPVTLTTISVQGYFRDPQGNNIAITSGNTVSENVAYVVLPAACYNYEGQFVLAIKLVGGGITGTVRIVDGMVDNTYTGGAITPAPSVATYDEVLAGFTQAMAVIEDSVRYGVDQSSKSAADKAQARANIEVAKDTDVVRYDIAQSGKTALEKAQARANIDAADVVDIAPVFNTSGKSLLAGDLVLDPVYSTLYKLKGNVSAGTSWNTNLADKTTLARELKSEISSVKSAFVAERDEFRLNSIWPYYYDKDFYYDSNLNKVEYSGTLCFRIPFEHLDILCFTWQGNPENVVDLGIAYAAITEYEDGSLHYGGWLTQAAAPNAYLDLTYKELFLIGQSQSKYVHLFINGSNMDGTEVLQLNRAFSGFADKRDNYISRISEETAVVSPAPIYFKSVSAGIWKLQPINDNNTYKTIWRKAYSGDKIILNQEITGISILASAHFADESCYNITGTDHTFGQDAAFCVFKHNIDGGETLYSPDKRLMLKKSDIIDINDETTPLLQGKIFCSFGDSITYQNLWQPHVITALGGTSIVCGIGSTPLSGSDANAFWKDVRLNTVKTANPDVLTILGGANDIILNPVVGTDSNLSDKDVNTFIGAYSYIINNLLTWKPSLKIIILSTTYAHNDGHDVSNDLTYGDFADACKIVAEYYHLPYVDLYNESGFNQYTMGTGLNAIYSSDKIHPNATGAKILASMVIQKIREIYGVVQ